MTVEQATGGGAGHGGGNAPAAIYGTNKFGAIALLQHEGHSHEVEQPLRPAIEHHQGQQLPSPLAPRALQEFLGGPQHRLAQAGDWKLHRRQPRGADGEGDYSGQHQGCSAKGCWPAPAASHKEAPCPDRQHRRPIAQGRRRRPSPPFLLVEQIGTIGVHNDVLGGAHHGEGHGGAAHQGEA